MVHKTEKSVEFYKRQFLYAQLKFVVDIQDWLKSPRKIISELMYSKNEYSVKDYMHRYLG